jgi:N-acyl-D-aspartate/D-glutamate deacylase
VHALTLEEAVHRLTALPSAQLGLADRGVVAPGLRADLVVFDPASIRDASSYEDPKRYPTGIDEVLVGGEVVVDHGAFTSARPGRPVRRPR